MAVPMLWEKTKLWAMVQLFPGEYESLAPKVQIFRSESGYFNPKAFPSKKFKTSVPPTAAALASQSLLENPSPPKLP